MKKIGILLLTLMALVFTGCLEDDGYSLSDMWVGLGILKETGGDPSRYKIVMDNKDVLVPVASNYNHYYDSDHSHFKDGDRVLMNYTVLGDNKGDNQEPTEYYIKINSIWKVLMKGILDITEANKDSIGNDPIIVKDIWMSDSLLNVKIKYWGHNKTHFINLVKQPGELTANNQPVELELRHNSNNDTESTLYSGYVSFKLNTLQITGLDSVQFRVTYSDYEGKQSEFKGTYRYGENN